jgi:hypothetical protein
MSHIPRFSVTPARAFLDPELSNAAKAVLGYMGMWVNHDGGEILIGQGTIAADMGLGRTTVNQACRELVEGGYLSCTRHRNSGGNFTKNTYAPIYGGDEANLPDVVSPGTVYRTRPGTVERTPPCTADRTAILNSSSLAKVTKVKPKKESKKALVRSDAFEAFWVEWRKLGFSAKTDRKNLAEKAFKALSAAEKLKATESVATWQREYRADYGSGITLRHAVRYLRDKDFLSIENSTTSAPGERWVGPG